MAQNEEFDKLKALLESSSDTEDKDAMLQNILNYIQNAKDDSGLDEEQLVHKLLADLRSIYKPQATYYEYLLFLGVVGLIVSIFSKRPPKLIIKNILWYIFLKKLEKISITNQIIYFSFRLPSTINSILRIQIVPVVNGAATKTRREVACKIPKEEEINEKKNPFEMNWTEFRLQNYTKNEEKEEK